MIAPLTRLWYLSDFFLDWLGKKRVTQIIRPGKMVLLADVMGSGTPEMFQALSSAGTRMMDMTLLTQPFWIDFFTITWWNRRCPEIVLEDNMRIHVSCKHYPRIPLVIIILIVFSNLYPHFRTWKLWLRIIH